MQTRSIWTRFETFKCNFWPFKKDSKHLNANSNHSNEIQSILMQIWTLRSIRMHILTIEKSSNNSNAYSTIEKGF